MRRLPIRLTCLFSSSLLLCLLLLMVPLQGFAQDAPSPDAAPMGPPGDPNPPQEESDPVATLKVNVNLVSLFFDARDKHGVLLPNLTKNDCTVAEDKVPQTMKNFTRNTDQPLTLGILLDTSGSQQNVLPMEQQTGAQFLKHVLRSKDEAFLIAFDVDTNLLSDFTNNATQLGRDMEKAQINIGGGGYGGPGIGQGPVNVPGGPKGTVLYDAVYLAAREKMNRETGRKAMILLTDGEDEGSNHKLADAIQAAQKANVMVYVLLIADRQGYFSQGMMYSGDSAMRNLADATGGRVINVGNNGKKMEEAFASIEDELRTQYIASYTPTNLKLDGGYRKVEVSCKVNGESVKVQSRKGYYAVAPEN
jgi:VWFA-related protein